VKTQGNSRERGVVGIMFAVMAIVLVGFTGMAIDVGYMRWQKSRLQGAASAAAMGALRELELSQTDLEAAGRNDAALNGFTNGQDNTTVTINNPPTLGNYSGDSTAVEAIVTKTVPTFFMRIFSRNSVNISVRAVARTTTTQGSVGACIFALNPTAQNAFEISGSSVVTTACGVVVNSSNSKAFVNSGGGELKLGNGAKIGVVGPGTDGDGWVISGGSKVTDLTTNQPESPVNIQTFNDPLANISAPTTPVAGGVQHDNNGSTWNIDSGHMPTGNQLSPGVYCGGISIQSTNGTLTFSPGTYILAGGGLTINASQSTVAGSGVIFYNTRTSTSNTWGCSKNNLNATKISINGGLGGSVTLTAPTSGSQTGVLFFEDRNLPQTLSNQITGGSYATFNGALYFKKSNLTFSGGSTASNGYLVIVADTITISGTSNLGNDHADLGDVYTLAPATTGGGLVE
jgi:Flp pilus assembly protein TadG